MTDAQIEAACRTLKRAIEAAENSNQAGEDFVMAAAAGPALLEALEETRGRLSGILTQFDHVGCTCTFDSDDCCHYAAADATLSKARAAITKARGQ